MIPRKIRLFGLFFGSTLFLATGGFVFIYGVVLFYLSMPGTRNPAYVLAPLNTVLLELVLNEVFLAVVLVGMSIFTIEVYQNGLLKIDDRIRSERMKEWRREKAEESEAWQPPPEDRETPSKYEQLLEEQSGRLLLAEEAMVEEDGQPSVKARVRNTSSVTHRNIVVKVGFVNSDGDVDEIRKATQKELRPSRSWEFQLFYNGERPDILDYRITSPRGTPVKG